MIELVLFSVTHVTENKNMKEESKTNKCQCRVSPAKIREGCPILIDDV